MLHWTIVIGAALISGVASYFLIHTYLGFAPTNAFLCAVAVTFGVGLVAHLNTPEEEDIEDGLGQ